MIPQIENRQLLFVCVGVATLLLLCTCEKKSEDKQTKNKQKEKFHQQACWQTSIHLLICSLADKEELCCYLYVRTPRAYLSIDGAGLLHHGVETWCLAGVLASGGARGSGGPGLVSSGRLWDRCGHRTSQLCSTVCWEAHHCPKKLYYYIFTVR